MKLTLPRSFGAALGLVPPTIVIAAAGACLWRSEGTTPHTLRADDDVSSDPDGDGLSDREERILQTSPVLADTDGDGFSDSEELARQMRWLIPDAAAIHGRLRLGATACDHLGQFEILLAVYLPDAKIRGKDLRLGLVAGHRVYEIARDDLLDGATIAFVPTQSEDAVVALVRIPFDEHVVHATGGLSVYATIGNEGTGIVAASAAIRMISLDNIALLCLPDPYSATPSNPDGLLAQQTGSTSTNGGTIFVPLTFDDDPPALWTPGQICYQKSSPVGAAGLLVTHEVVRADCMDNWDAFCPPTCSASVGTTFEDVDPLALLGG